MVFSSLPRYFKVSGWATNGPTTTPMLPAGMVHWEPAPKGLATSADIVVNISGVNPIRSWFENVPIRVFVDTDPAFTQIRHMTDPKAMSLALQHTEFFTLARTFLRQIVRSRPTAFRGGQLANPSRLTPGR